MASTAYIKLSDLTAKIGNTLQQTFGSHTYWVLAEITNCSFQQQKGHWFFECVEKAAGRADIISRVACVAWKEGVERIRNFEHQTGEKFRNGIGVLLKVTVDFHPVYGMKLCLQDIDPQYTIGALELQKQKTLERLLLECADFITKSGDRYLTRNNQLTLPRVLQNIAVISSKSAAGYEDFRYTLEHNSFNYRFRVDSYYTFVQGEANASAVRAKLLEVYNSGKVYDVVVIIRGGGSQTDFLIFDQYELGKVVAKFPVPIITGLGHQKNQTIVDMMAHTSTTAPTKAAEFIIAHNRSFDAEMDAIKQRIIIRSQQKISFLQKELNRLRNSFTIQVPLQLSQRQKKLSSLSSSMLNKPLMILSHHLKDIGIMQKQIGGLSARMIKNQQGYLAHYLTLFRMMSPLNILKKGFAMVKVEGAIETNGENIREGKDISIILSGREIEATVISNKSYNGNEFDL